MNAAATNISKKTTKYQRAVGELRDIKAWRTMIANQETESLLKCKRFKYL